MPVKHCHVLIDGFRAADTWSCIEKFAVEADARAEKVNLTWKEADSYMGTSYTFNGVKFDHVNGTVAAGDKISRRIAKGLKKATTNAEAESLVARLIHAAAIVDPSTVSEFYWAVKWTRRRISAMNRGEDPRTQITVPGNVYAQLRRWSAKVAEGQSSVPLPDVQTRAPEFVMFTDASKVGCGAVLVCMLTGKIYIAGKRWAPGHEYEINKDEMNAVEFATQAFAHHFRRGTVVDLRVDNSSTEAGTNKGSSTSWEVSVPLNKFMQSKKRYGINMRATHVDTKMNWADPVSRGKPLVLGDKGSTSEREVRRV